MSNEELPAGDPNSPPLSFEEIDQRLFEALCNIHMAHERGQISRGDKFDAELNVTLATIKEICKTLMKHFPDRRIQVPGASGHG